MIYEVIVEEFVLQVEITHLENTPAQPSSRDSDWDFQGCRELEFEVLSGITYSDSGERIAAGPWVLSMAARRYADVITLRLWEHVDSRKRYAA